MTYIVKSKQHFIAMIEKKFIFIYKPFKMYNLYVTILKNRLVPNFVNDRVYVYDINNNDMNRNAIN